MSKLGLALIVAVVLAGASRCDAQAPDPDRLPVRTRFDPRIDGQPFINTGDWRGGGNCWGMSVLAIDAYRRRIRDGRPAVRHEGSPPPAGEAPPAEQATASLVQEQLLRFDLRQGAEELRRRTPVRQATTLLNQSLARIAATGTPEVLTTEATSGAHAMVLFGWEAGRLRVYDPNYPGETIEWPFDPETGLGDHPLAASEPLYRVNRVGATPQDAHAVAKAVTSLQEACANQDAECVDRFPRITAGLRRQGERVEVVGSVAREGLARPDRLWVVVNGRRLGPVPVSRFGTFRAPVPEDALNPDAPNQVQLVATRAELFSGFRRLEATTPPGPTSRPAARPARTPGLAGAVSRRR